MSELRRLVHNKNIRKEIHSNIISKINNEIKTMNFEILLNNFYEYKNYYNSDINIREYKYHIIDMTYPKSLRYNIIDNYLIFHIKNQLNFYFGYDNIVLVYYFTEFENNIIVSFYLMFGNIDDFPFLIIS
jgi:hypothetical protein